MDVLRNPCAFIDTKSTTQPPCQTISIAQYERDFHHFFDMFLLSSSQALPGHYIPEGNARDCIFPAREKYRATKRDVNMKINYVFNV